jgi:hypothetical protein
MKKPITILLDREYKLVWDFNAMTEFECITGKSAFADLGKELQKASGVRAILFASMVSAGEKVELSKVGSLLTMKDFVSVSEILRSLLDESYGTSEEAETEEKKQ